MRPSASSPDVSRANLFPLPLTPFEYYYYLDDGPDYPTTFPVELTFSGTLVREHFQRALEGAVRRHPMLRARIEVLNARPQWVWDRRTRPEFDWADASVPIAPEGGEFIDLTSDPGLRTWVRTSPGGARHVLLQFHHACCDGLSALHFARDLLAAYRIAAELDRGPLGELDAELLRRRGELIGPSDPKPSLRDGYYSARLWWQILFRSPTALAFPPRDASAEQAPPSGPLLAFESETLDGPQTVALREIAAARGVTVNDLLLRDFLLVLRQWNGHSVPRAGKLRVNVPVNVRRADEARMPAANRIGFGFVTVEADEAADPDRLLEVVRGETNRMKEWKLGLYFLGGLQFASRVPYLLRWALRRNRSFATAVLSNVGRFVPDSSPERRGGPWTCGELALTRVTGVPPLRKLTRAAVIVIEYAGQTTLSLRCDPRDFSVPETRALLDSFAARIRETLQPGR